jgi:HPt (histidine-containing phosphotransfer) domain-containing protein
MNDKVKLQIEKDIQEAIDRFRKKDRVIKLYESFFESFEDTLDMCKTHVANQDYFGLAKSLHTIKGSSGNIKMNLIHDLVVNLEAKAKAKDNNEDYIKHLNALKIYAKMYQDMINVGGGKYD